LPDTVGVPIDAPVDASAAASALSAAVTTDGTLELSVVTIDKAAPAVSVPVCAVVALVGHTRIPVAATVAVSLRRVGDTMNVSVVSAAVEPLYVAANDPADTDVASELNDPLEATSALAGVAPTNVTGTEMDVPPSSVSPVANAPSVTLVASTSAAMDAERSVSVHPSGAVTTRANLTAPDAGATPPSVYTPTDAECDPAAYVHVGAVP
jgi:hypothetical protein